MATVELLIKGVIEGLLLEVGYGGGGSGVPAPSVKERMF